MGRNELLALVHGDFGDLAQNSLQRDGVRAVRLDHQGRFWIEAHGQQFARAVAERLPRRLQGPVFLAGIGLLVVERVPLGRVISS
jgi:hypothetical protein